MSIYKACDIRGVYGDDLTEETMFRIGRAMATILAERTGAEHPSVLVGGDVRTSTPALKKKLVDGLTVSGARVLNLGVVPTPAFYEAFHQLDTDGCAMVTASHNPAEFNGMKLCFGHRPVTPEEIELLSRVAEEGNFAEGKGSIEQVDFSERYEVFIRSHFSDKVELEVVLDAGNGCYSAVAPAIMRDIGLKVVPLFCEPDGRFPNRSPNPAYDPLEALCETVRKEKADYGVAFDGDGDRVSFVDDRGRRVVIDKAIVLLARHTLNTAAAGGPMKAVYEVNCSQIVPEEMERCGATPLIEKAGHAFMKTRMIEEDAVFGGEVSGHFFYRALHGGDDGLYSAIRMGVALKEWGKALSQLVEEVPTYCIGPVMRMKCDADYAQRAVEKIAAAAKGLESSDIDGIRVTYEEGWGLARPSITEPVLSMRFEAKREEDLEGIVRRFLEPAPEALEFALKRLQEWKAAGRPL